MIEINLLPENLRKAESTPLPRQLTIYLGVAVCAGLLFLNWFYMNESSKADKKLKRVTAEVNQEQQKITALDNLIAEIEQIKSHVTTVEDLYRNRTIWAKILFDLKNIINEQEYNKANDALEYLWLTSLSLEESRSSGGFGMPAQKTKTMKLEGQASAKNTRRATMMVRNLIDSMVKYTPEKSPEEEAMEKIEERIKLREAIEEKLKDGKKKKKLSAMEERKIRAEEELIKHLKDKKSGGIATMPFMKFFDESTREVKLKWSENSSGGSNSKMKQMPGQAMKFELKLGFAPKKKAAPQVGF